MVRQGSSVQGPTLSRPRVNRLSADGSGPTCEILSVPVFDEGRDPWGQMVSPVEGETSTTDYQVAPRDPHIHGELRPAPTTVPGTGGG